MSTIKTVRVNDCSQVGNFLEAIKHDLRQTNDYYVVPDSCRAPVHVYIEISSVNKGDNDEREVATIHSYDKDAAEKVKRLIAGRFSSPSAVSVSLRPRIEQERKEAQWREREFDFLSYMRQFEGVDFT